MSDPTGRLGPTYEADLSTATIDYVDTGGPGPVVVLLHGVNMDATLWTEVVPRLAPQVRCIVPTLPLGSHRHAAKRPELVTHEGVAALVGELLEVLDLHDVTLVLNDWGGAQLLVADRMPGADRVAALALVACEAFDNFPPGLPGRAVASSARIPAVLWLTMQLQRFGWFRRAPGGWGWMSRRPVPDALMDGWFAPARTDAGVRRDLRTFALSTPSAERLAQLVERVADFGGPVAVVWADDDRLMPADHGPRLAALFARGRLVRVPDSRTLVPLDRPDVLADVLRELAAEADPQHPEAGQAAGSPQRDSAPDNDSVDPSTQAT